MRQAGIVAAAGVYALDHNVERLADDHARAKRLALGLAEAGLAVDPDAVETNFVQLDVAPLSKEEAIALLAEQGVGLSATIHPTVLRAVTHLDVDDEDIDARSRRSRAHWERVSAPDPLREDFERRLRGRAGRAAAAVGRGGGLPRRRDRCGRRRSGSRTSTAAREATPRDPVPDRLDHEDVHRRLRSCSCATRASSRSTTR